MLALVKKLFIFKYRTNLTPSECRERLSPDYVFKVFNDGRLPKRTIGWKFDVHGNNKPSIKAVSEWGNQTFVYRISIDVTSDGSQIICRHFPFAFLGMFFPAVLALLALSGLIFALIDGNYYYVAPLFLCSLVFIFICAAWEYCARRRLNEYLVKILECKPL